MAKDEMTPVRCKVVLALADNRMRVTEAARSLYMNHATVIYHIKLIKALTGKDPMNFYDLIDLVRMVREVLTDEF